MSSIEARVKKIVVETAEKVFEEQGTKLEYHIGTMIEIPRAAVTADEIASDRLTINKQRNDLNMVETAVD